MFRIFNETKIEKRVDVKKFLNFIKEYKEEQIECTEHTFFRLSEKQRKIFTCDELKKLIFKKNPFCGIQIPKKLIPKEYIQKFKIHNLWKYNLPGAWRLIYSIKGGEIFIVTIILEWVNHKEYEKRFKY